jgi:hypothetical protein
MKPYGSVRIARMWYAERTYPVLMCLVNPDGLNCRDLLVGVVLELTSWLTV